MKNLFNINFNIDDIHIYAGYDEKNKTYMLRIDGSGNFYHQFECINISELSSRVEDVLWNILNANNFE